MSFTDHKITAFAHKIADLPDQPTLPPDELKSRFDACPEELRQSLNAICDDAARLEARVEGIVVDTFGDTIDKEMLSDELAAELDGKATQSALSAEAAARESADDALEQALEQQIAQKCEVLIGQYNANGAASQTISLGRQPKAVFIYPAESSSIDNGSSFYSGLAMPDCPVRYESFNKTVLEVTETGFTVYYSDTYGIYLNRSGKFRYIAFM